ncbi:MAG: efflux transporter periplasmic adaptor subunit, partial [Agrobacterium sp.]|nr:efflux transporter periplasmic adaptor subunit [Agrobacterium sp.]
MRVWKQVGVSVAVVGAGLCLWGFYSPEARNVLAAIGLGKMPAGAIEVAASGAGTSGTPAGQNAGGARRNGNTTLVVMAPVKKGTVNDRLNAIGNG